MYHHPCVSSYPRGYVNIYSWSDLRNIWGKEAETTVPSDLNSEANSDFIALKQEREKVASASEITKHENAIKNMKRNIPLTQNSLLK